MKDQLTKLQLTTIVNAVRAVHEARQRIPLTVDTGITYFSELDQWFFRAISDDRICDSCTELDGSILVGSVLRTGLPYMEILDEDTIRALVHPNCRCLLLRLTKTPYYDVPKITKWED